MGPDLPILRQFRYVDVVVELMLLVLVVSELMLLMLVLFVKSNSRVVLID
jgi:hypothetical protein